jgi:hypothetical protein
MGYNAHMKVVKMNCSAKPNLTNCDDTTRHAIVVVEVYLEVTETAYPITPEDFNFYGLDNDD